MVERAKGVLPKAHYLLVGVMLGRYVSYRSNQLGPVVTSIQTGHFLLTEKSNLAINFMCLQYGPRKVGGANNASYSCSQE